MPDAKSLGSVFIVLFWACVLSGPRSTIAQYPRPTDQDSATPRARARIEFDPERSSRIESPLLDPPLEDDLTAASLAAYQRRLERRYGGYARVPLDVKAAYFEWEMWRYHRTPFRQIYNRVYLPDEVGAPTRSFPWRDASTWHGALMAGLAYRYAATRDPVTLERLAEVARGTSFFFEVTGQPGYMARAISRADGVLTDDLKPNRYVAPDGLEYYYHGDPAKGGYNQIAAGYAALMMFAYDDLPEDVRQMVRKDITAMVLHLLDHDYQATDARGVRSTYGDMRPLVGGMSVPFQAQVAYAIVALGYSFPPDDRASRERIEREFTRLRGRHHVYYEDPWVHPFPPQRVGGSPFVKGMNDRAHVVSAAFTGLSLEFHDARSKGVEWNEKFTFQLGQTMVHAMAYLGNKRNSLCAFMWAGLLEQKGVADAILARAPDDVRSKAIDATLDGIEQLRRFRLDRFARPGVDIEERGLQWCDGFRPVENLWHWSPYLRHEVRGEPTNEVYAAIDFLYAYWLLRYFRLDEQSAVAQRRLPELARTPGVETAPR